MHFALIVSLAVAQAAGAGSSESASERFAKEMAAYDIRSDGPQAEPLVLRQEPLLRWTNPSRNGEDGATFVWMQAGRPAVIGTAFTFRVGQSIGHAHEFHSLAGGPLTARTQGTTTWKPRTAGVEIQRLQDVPRPGRTEPQRLIQMRLIARKHSAEFFNAEGVPTQLRLMAQPLLRYAAPEQGVLDGAVFAFAMATDPEVLLILEARGSPQNAVWQAAFARSHFRALRATRDEQVVWDVDPRLDLLKTQFGDGVGIDESYIIYRFPYKRYAPSPSEDPPSP